MRRRVMTPAIMMVFRIPGQFEDPEANDELRDRVLLTSGAQAVSSVADMMPGVLKDDGAGMPIM